MSTKFQILIYLSVITLLTLSAVNINNLYKPTTVLGLTVVEDQLSSKDFWIKFLKDNPYYLPGYIEIENYEALYKLDPNFIP